MNNQRMIKIIKNFLFVIAFCLLLPALVYFSKGNLSQTFTPYARALSQGWYYTEGNRRIEVTLPAIITGIEGNTLTLYNNTLTENDTAMALTTRAAAYEPIATFNKGVIYQYREGKFRRNSQMRSKVNCLFQLPAVKAGDRISITYHREDSSEGFNIPDVYLGYSSAMILYYCRSNLFTIGIICLMYLLGIISLSIYGYMSYKHIKEPRLLDLTGFLLLAGTWCLTDSSLAQLFGGVTDTVLYVSFFCFMLFPVPMINFVQNTANMKEHRIFNFLNLVFYLNAIIQIIVHITCGIDMIDMLFVTHICLISGISLLVYTLFREYRISGDKELISISVSFLLLSFFGILALLLYWAVNFTYYQEVYEFGILLFIIMLLYRVLITLTENFQTRTEMEVYLRLSKIDEMTNLKNRRSFNEDTDEVALRTNPNENPLLVFFDLNFLKYVNDTHGHSAGDELILGAARVIEKVFGMGNCYRIGGDEFAAILHEPYVSITELNENLDKEIRFYNQSQRDPLSLARGYSTLLDKQGRPKTISDWKCEADQKMYKNKLEDKLRRARLPRELSDMELLLQEYGIADVNGFSEE